MGGGAWDFNISCCGIHNSISNTDRLGDFSDRLRIPESKVGEFWKLVRMGSWLQKQASTEHRDEHKKRSVLETWNFPQSRETRTRRRGLPCRGLSGKEPICQRRRCRSWFPGPGRSHTLGSTSARAPQLLSRNAETADARVPSSPGFAREATAGGPRRHNWRAAPTRRHLTKALTATKTQHCQKVKNKSQVHKSTGPAGPKK